MSEPLGLLILIPLGCLGLIQFLFVVTGTMGIADGALADTDAYMRMVRVQELHTSGNWFDATLPRVNPPEGHVQHWTRPLDAVLLAGALLLKPLLGFDDALHLFGVLISPIMLALTVLALDWAARPILSREARLIACLALLLQMFVMAYTIIGRPDHHSLLFLLFTLALGLGGRLLLTPDARGPAAAAGAVVAVGIWVSLEALVFIAVVLFTLGLYWLLGDRRIATALRNMLGAATACLVVALLIERGPVGLLAVENDRLSILHATLFLLLALFWTIVDARPSLGGPAPEDRDGEGQIVTLGLAGSGGRLVVMAAGACVTALLVLVVFPEVREGPLGRMDPFYVGHRFLRIVEFQPLIQPAWIMDAKVGFIGHRFLQTFGIGLLALPFLGHLLLRRWAPAHRVWVLLALALVVYVTLAFHQQRWAAYAQLVLVMPYAAFVMWLLERMTAHLGHARRVLWWPATIAVALFWPIVIPPALPAPDVETAGRACPIEGLASTLNRIGDDRGRLILAYADYSPALLYLTPHEVLSIPNHRLQPGYRATHRILTAADPGAARAEIERRGVDWILLCPSESEQALFSTDGERPTLYDRLAAGRPPAWLEPVALPDAYRDEARLFAVREPDASPQTARR